MGLKVSKFLTEFFNRICSTGKLPKQFKDSKVVAIIKPGTDGDDTSHYKPISLLCVPYKLLESIRHSRIVTIVGEILPI